jgi:hypothetical protein
MSVLLVVEFGSTWIAWGRSTRPAKLSRPTSTAYLLRYVDYKPLYLHPLALSNKSLFYVRNLELDAMLRK